MSEGRSNTDYSFGQIAIEQNFCTIERVKECLDVQGELRKRGVSPMTLGQILVQKGYLTAEQASHIARLQIQARAGKTLNLPGYELLEKLGQGAMGTVFKARQISMDRTVAVKVLSGKYAKDRSFIERFLREARAVAKLNHENIISGIDAGEVGNVRYFVMEYVDGETVLKILRRCGTLPEKQVLQIARQMASALEHAHRHGLVHRDVKPENILISSEGVAKLCDLGLAKQAKEDLSLTLDGMSVGTPHYISPEQARGEDDIDIRSDVYSLGATLYHLLVGKTPYEGPNPTVVMTKHVTDPLVPPRQRNPEVSPAVNQLIVRMMQKRREDRYASPTELLADLDPILKGDVPHPIPIVRKPPSTSRVQRRETRQEPRPSAVPHPGRRRRRSASVVFSVAALLLLAVGAYGIYRHFQKEESRGEPGSGALSGTGDPSSSGGVSRTVEPDPAHLEEERRLEELIRKHGDPADPGFLTVPWRCLQENRNRFERTRHEDDWVRLQNEFTAKRNRQMEESVWKPLEAEVGKLKNEDRHAAALATIARLDPKFLHFDEEKRVPTALQMKRDELARETKKSQDDAKMLFKRKAGDSKLKGDYDDAYLTSESLSLCLGEEGAAEVTDLRIHILQEEWEDWEQEPVTAEGLRKIRDRIRTVRERYGSEVRFVRECDALLTRVDERERKSSDETWSRAESVYKKEFLPVFERALEERNVLAARSQLRALLGDPKNADLQGVFRSAKFDVPLLLSYLEGKAPLAQEWAALLGMSEAAFLESPDPLHRGVALHLRLLLFLDSALDRAGAGAAASGRIPNGLKDFPGAFQGALTAAPAPRGERAPHALKLTFPAGVSRKEILPLEPRSSEAPQEETLVRLMEWSYPGPDPAKQAAKDPHHLIRVGLLYHFAKRHAQAKSAFASLTDPVLLSWMERYKDLYANVVSSEEEERAVEIFKLFLEHLKPGWRSDGLAEGRELQKLYARTEYLNGILPKEKKTRAEFVEEKIPILEAELKRIDDLFAGTYEEMEGRSVLTYTFQSNEEMNDWDVYGWMAQPFDAIREGGGCRVEGTGTLYFKAPWEGDVALEVMLTPLEDHSLGFVLAGDVDPFADAGYLAFLNFDKENLARWANQKVESFVLHPILELPIRTSSAKVIGTVRKEKKNWKPEKDRKISVLFLKQGKRLVLSCDTEEIAASSSQADEDALGRVGLAVWNSSMRLHEVKIRGILDLVWLELQDN